MARTTSAKIKLPNDGVERKCWACKNMGMEPHEPVHPDSVSSCPLWFFKCPYCGARFQWVVNPKMDGSLSEKHKTRDGGFLTTSMLSDPDNPCFSEDTKASANKLDYKPEKIEYGTPVFVYDEQGNKTHRWHWGRMEWVKREVER